MSKKEGNFTFLGSLFEIVKIVPYDRQEMTHNNREEFYKKFGGGEKFSGWQYYVPLWDMFLIYPLSGLFKTSWLTWWVMI